MMKVKRKAREASIRAVVRRADGTTEDLGIVSYWHRNPIKRWAFKLKRIVKWLRS